MIDIEKYIKSGIVDQYVLGLASPEEQEEVEFMAKKYPEIDKYICELQNCMDSYAEMQAIPPKRFKKANGTSDSGDSETSNIPSVYKWITGIAALMILGLSAVILQLYQNQQNAYQKLGLISTQMLHLQNGHKALKASNDKMMTSYSVLKDINTRHFSLKGSNIAPQALAVVYWNKDHDKAFLNPVNIPIAPPGYDYQIWGNVNGQHVSMGILNVTDTMTWLHSLPCLKNCKGIVITLEKAGGSEQPTVEKLFVKGEM